MKVCYSLNHSVLHYSERQDKPFSLQIQLLEVYLKLNCVFNPKRQDKIR